MNPDDLRRLLDYHYWARDRILEAAEHLSPEQYTKELGSSFKSVRDTLVHVYSADWVWNSRWHGVSPMAMIPYGDYPDVASVRRAWQTVEQEVRELFRDLDADGIAREMDYKLMSGLESRSVLWQMAQHVVNHGSYHRGQVTTMIRQLGGTPPKSMDLITFYREHAAGG